MLTSLIRFVFISFLFSSAAVFSADNASIPTEPSSSKAAPQPTLNTQLPEWFYRELTSIRKDVSVLDATGASKEQITELKERIGTVEVRLEEFQLRVNDKLNEQSGRIGDIADSNSFSVTLFSILAGILGLLIAGLSWLFSWSAKREAVASAKEEAQTKLTAWMKEKDGHYEKALQTIRDNAKEQNDYHEKEFQKVRDYAEEQAFDNDINEAYALSKVNNDGAISRINNVIKKVENSDLERNQRLNAKALYYKGLIHLVGNQQEGSIKFFRELATSFKESNNIDIQQWVVSALANIGLTLGQLNRSEEAIVVYDDIVNRFKYSKEKSIQEYVATVLSNKAELVLVIRSKQDAKKSIQDAILFIKDEYKLHRAMTELMSFMIEDSIVDEVLSKVEIIPDGEITGWGFDELRPAIKKLKSPRKEQVEAFARFFEGHHDKAKLKEELDQIFKK